LPQSVCQDIDDLCLRLRVLATLGSDPIALGSLALLALSHLVELALGVFLGLRLGFDLE